MNYGDAGTLTKVGSTGDIFPTIIRPSEREAALRDHNSRQQKWGKVVHGPVSMELF